MEYMTKVECWSISIGRSCHIGPSRTSNCFDLKYPEDVLYIKIILNIYIDYIKNEKDGQSNLFISRFNRRKKEKR